MHRLLLLGLNHTTAPLEVRERLAFSAEGCRRAIEAFRQRFPGSELVLLSTCNRVELYASRPVHGRPRVEEMVEFLSTFHGVAPEAVRPHVYDKADRAVVEHLFSVASSLDSMVLGETQILGQVREAYERSTLLAAAGPELNPLFQRALAVGKQVMHETGLGEGRLSVASVAVDYARRIFDHFDDKTVLCIGAGKMAALVLQSFAGLKPKHLLICNRDLTKAQALATRFNGQAVPFERLDEHLVAADVVISSTGATRPIITRGQFARLLKDRRYRPVFLIDIALPRDIEAGVGELENVYLYNLDDLQQVVAATQSQRNESVSTARSIVVGHVVQFAQWHRSREMGPVIERLTRTYHQIAQDELARTLNKLPNIGDAERAHLEDLTRRIVNKLLHNPIKALRESDTDTLHGPAAYLHAMEKLFQLDARDVRDARDEADETKPD